MSDKQEENTFLQQELENEGLDLNHDHIKVKGKIKAKLNREDYDDYELKHRDE